MKKPNLLVILIDDLRFDEFGAGGQGHFRMAFCTSIATLEEGMTRLKEALDPVR